MSMNLQGKNAVITGARSGIGLATLCTFAQNGINCWAIIHRSDNQFTELISSLQKEYGVWIEMIDLDLGNTESLRAGVQCILQTKKNVDILVNAAGIISSNQMFVMTRMADMRRVMDVNFFSVIELTQLISRRMMRQRSGSIINITSIAAYGEDTSQMEYAASKAALSIATKKIARELAAFGIRVNAIAPGWTQTKMLDGIDEHRRTIIQKGLAMHRFAETEEIAEVCLFLAGEHSKYINGETIKVDGGGFDIRSLLSCD